MEIYCLSFVLFPKKDSQTRSALPRLFCFSGGAGLYGLLLSYPGVSVHSTSLFFDIPENFLSTELHVLQLQLCKSVALILNLFMSRHVHNCHAVG